MNIVLSYPLALLALSALPALAAIYLLRSRFRAIEVSSLIFWQQRTSPRHGGLHLNRIYTPLLFVLEAITILLLTASAAGPLVRSGRDTRALVIVLDDSFSMLARDEECPRDRAEEAIRGLLSDSGSFQARFILAGKQPQLLDPPVTSLADFPEVCSEWRCLSPVADLQQAAALALELAGSTARVLVVSDHKPQTELESGRLEWRAYGRPLPNLAFVAAARNTFDSQDRCLLAIANLSGSSTAVHLVVEELKPSQTTAPQAVLTRTIQIQAGATHHIAFTVPEQSGPLAAAIQTDHLDIDNRAILAPDPRKVVRVQIQVANELLNDAVTRAVEAADMSRMVSASPDLLITDAAGSFTGSAVTWTVRVIAEPNAAAFVGPFILDNSHPITEGMSLDGLIWAAGRAASAAGSVVVAAGNVPLISDRQSPTGTHDITIRLDPAISTLIRSPNWPVLIANILRWRQSRLPGIERANYPIGATVTASIDTAGKSLTLTDPIGQETALTAGETSNVSFEARLPGLYSLADGDKQYAFAANALSRSESDLAGAAFGRWGGWQQADLFWWEYRRIDWLLLIAALLALALHRFVACKHAGE